METGRTCTCNKFILKVLIGFLKKSAAAHLFSTLFSTAVELSEGSNCYTRNFTLAANVDARQQSIQIGKISPVTCYNSDSRAENTGLCCLPDLRTNKFPVLSQWQDILLHGKGPWWDELLKNLTVQHRNNHDMVANTKHMCS